MCSKGYQVIQSTNFLWQIVGCIIVLSLFKIEITLAAIRKGNLLVPTSYTSGNGDLHVQLHSTFTPGTKILTSSSALQNTLSSPAQDFRLQITKIEESGRTTVAIIDVYPDPRSNVTQISIPCKHFLFGGLYELEIVGNDILSSLDSQDERLRQQLDVRWPVPKLSITPESIGTYPSQPVEVIFEFKDVECPAPSSVDERVPEFWLELFYCGHESFCDSANVSTSQVLYREQVRGYPKRRIVNLNCELFGLAGHYSVKLRPDPPASVNISVTANIKADWSEQFVFNVHARSISPCDPHTGIGVLFEYPACILDRADRVRLFAKLRADVASLAPPTSLHYVTEQRVIRGQHSLHFDCELFSEKYVEYCFVYVSQAISGAVADIRMDCLPTLPVSDSDIGGWGPWSEWTACSTTCAGGTRNRYRVCDSPPPRYGAQFCQGNAVETKQCGGPISGTWECLYGNGNSFLGELPADRPEVKAEIGPGCRCGCIVHLSVSKPRRLIASSAESCPGRTFWLIQADLGYRIRFTIDFFRLICPTQYLRIRDGDSLAAELIAEYIGGNDKSAKPIISSESQILLEFYSNELSTLGESCKGGFLIHANQYQPYSINASMSLRNKAMMAMEISPIAIKLTLVHIIAILFASIVIVVSALLGAQYIFRYRKYQLAKNMGEPDSPAHTPRTSLGSIPVGRIASRASSTSTLISEVTLLVKLRSKVGSKQMKHSRLRESIDCEGLENECESGGQLTEFIHKANSEDNISNESSHTLTVETSHNALSSLSHAKDNKTATSNEEAGEHSSTVSSSPSCSPPFNTSISLPLTPLSLRKSLNKKFTYTSETKSMNGQSRIKPRDINSCNAVNNSATASESNLVRRMDKMSISNVTLTNSCNSPALSLSTNAKIRPKNMKECKEKQNREKLLAGPGSEFSLANPEDFELDYYDYNVINAGAAPGSYLGMDPAYLVWIPPLDGGDIIQEIDDENEPHYEEILSSSDYEMDLNNAAEHLITTGSPNRPPLLVNAQETPLENKNQKNSELSKILAAKTLCNASSISIADSSSSAGNCSQRSSCSSNSAGSSKTLSPYIGSEYDLIQMQEFPTSNNYSKSNQSKIRESDSAGGDQQMRVKGTSRSASQEEEKETVVLKYPSSDEVNIYYELDDIQFADDEDGGESDNRKNIKIPPRKEERSCDNKVST